MSLFSDDPPSGSASEVRKKERDTCDATFKDACKDTFIDINDADGEHLHLLNSAGLPSSSIEVGPPSSSRRVAVLSLSSDDPPSSRLRSEWVEESPDPSPRFLPAAPAR